MLTESDLIRLPYTCDLSEGGIAYACRALACSTDRHTDSRMNLLRGMAGGVAVELAFRRYLTGQAVPFDVLGATPFTRPDHYDLALGGHRCNVKSFLITRRSQITQIRSNPGSLLQAPALIPLDQFAAEGHKADDLYLFAFLLGLETVTQADMKKALAAGQPMYYIHALPEQWSQPVSWAPLENLALKSESDRPITVEIGGQDSGHNFISVTLELHPGQRQLVEKGFHSLAYINTRHKPEARIGIHCRRHGDPIIIPPHAWDNLWLYGMDIFLTGWLTHEEYRRKASVLNIGRRTFQYDATLEKNLLVPIRELNPLGWLLGKVKTWEIEKKSSFATVPSS